MSAAIARNAPCPCGSGKRFKDCHGALIGVAAEPATADHFMREAQDAARSDRWTAALSSLRRARELAPERADILREQARAEWTLRDPQAVASCRAALEREPADSATRNLLGEILLATDPEMAEATWREVLELDPDNAEALFHLGNRHRERAHLETAIEYYERALKRAPGHAGVLNNLGLALEGIGRKDRAEECYREVLTAQPQHADALANLANLLHGQGRHREAAAFYDKAIAICRNFPATFWMSRGITLGELRALAEAEQSFREAGRLDPDLLDTQVNIASMCIAQGKYDEAEGPLIRVLELDPKNAYAAVMLAHGRKMRCEWAGLNETFARVQALIVDAPPRPVYNAAPFPLLAMPLGLDVELAGARRWAQQIAAQAGAATLSQPAAARASRARLRLGFVSSDFRDHAITYLLLDCWERIDRSRFEVFAYSLLPKEVSPTGERAVRAFEHFADMSKRSAAEIARRIHDDQIDVLIDLNGYTSLAKSEIFALKPAPVQASWLGYLGTMGAEWYDYVFTDRFVSPPSAQAFFTERFVHLPDCYCPNDSRRPVATTAPSRADCGLPETGSVFCCFNSSFKILPAIFDIWMRLLEATPDSVLWLVESSSPSSTTNLRREAHVRGIDPARLVFARRVDLPEHLARHVHADLFLDTFPYNAGSTANDALFLGVPVLTCAGVTMASRVAGSQLHAIGLQELVTANLSEYEALALHLARTPRALARYREQLRDNRTTHPLFDMTRFVRNFEDVLAQIWRDHTARMSSA